MAARTFKTLFLVGLPLSLVVGPWVISLGTGIEQTARLSPLVCPLRWATGFLCPTCGLGRSLVACWSGQVAAGFEFHFLGPVILILSVAYWCALCFDFEPRLKTALQSLQLQLSPTALPAIALYSLWGLWRNL